LAALEAAVKMDFMIPCIERKSKQERAFEKDQQAQVTQVMQSEVGANSFAQTINATTCFKMHAADDN
jgi:hypothetical protein